MIFHRLQEQMLEAFGVAQINAGLNYLIGLPIGPEVQLSLIVCVTLRATILVATGIDRGVRILSETNLVIAILLLMFVLLMGPTTELLRTFNIHAYEPTPWVSDGSRGYDVMGMSKEQLIADI